MLAIVVALALEDGDALADLLDELRGYKLNKLSVGILQSGQHAVPKECKDDADNYL